MDMQDLLHRYFGTSDLESIDPAIIPAGTERMLVDFGLEEDSRHKFALWSLLLMLDSAPDLDVAFEREEDREAARNLMALLAASAPE